MEASRAATGMLDVFATRAVRSMIETVLPSFSVVNCKIGYNVIPAPSEELQEDELRV